MEISDARPGQLVRYMPPHCNGNIEHRDVEEGIVSSANDKFIFVRYNEGITGAATPPEHLTVLKEPENV